MSNMLQKVGWKKDFVLKSTPVLPISGWCGPRRGLWGLAAYRG